MDNNVAIATVIAEQLGQSTGNLVRMIGAHTFTAGEKSLTFKFKAPATNKSNCVRVTLEPSDTYKVEFLSLRGMSFKVKGEFEDIYAEDLKSLFERETGLYLTF